MTRYDHALRRACVRAREWYAAKSAEYHERDALLDDSTPPHPGFYVLLAVLIAIGVGVGAAALLLHH